MEVKSPVEEYAANPQRAEKETVCVPIGCAIVLGAAVLLLVYGLFKRVSGEVVFDFLDFVMGLNYTIILTAVSALLVIIARNASKTNWLNTQLDKFGVATPGEITSVEKLHGRDGTFCVVSYQFNVDGKTFRVIRQLPGRELDKRLLSDQEVSGQKVQVRYLSHDPRVSRAE
jgi:hypothetical protein